MKREILYIISCLVFLATSCEKWGKLEERYPDRHIYLSAGIQEGRKTKTPYTQTTPTPDYHLNATVWASTTENIYINEGLDGTTGKEVSIHTYAFFQSAEPQLLGQAIYPPPIVGDGETKTAPPVYFVAMYPRSGDFEGHNWTTPEEGEQAGKIAQYSFDGSQDVMFAGKVSGSYDTAEQGTVVTQVPELKFEHLLTLFTVKIQALIEDGVSLYDIQSAWGQVVGLKIQCWNSSGWGENITDLTIDLSTGDVTCGEGDKTTYTTFYNTGLNTEFPSDENGLTLIDTPAEVAYTICAPVNASNAEGVYEYELTIETQKEGQEIKETIIPIDLMESGDAGVTFLNGSSAGRHFEISLNFKKSRAIAVVASVQEWQTGGQGNADIVD